MRKKQMIILFIGIAVGMLGYGIGLPVLPFIIEQFGGGAAHMGIMVSLYGIMQFIFAPFWGKISDFTGRKSILIIGMLGFSLAMLLFGISQNLLMIYFAQIISGALSCAMFPVSMAYIGDLADDSEKGAMMGKLGAAVGLGMIFGPAFGGVLARFSIKTPFYVASILCIINLIFIIMFLSESLPKEERTSENKVKISVPVNLFKMIKGSLGFGLFTAFAVNFGKSNFTSIYGFYASEKLGYGPEDIGNVLMVISIIYLVAQGFIVSPLIEKFGEEKIINGSFLGSSLGFLFIIFSKTSFAMILSIGFFMVMNALLKPCTLSFISKNSDGNKGEVMGFTESYMSLGRILGPIFAGVLFNIGPELPYIFGAFIFILFFIYSISRKEILQLES